MKTQQLKHAMQLELWDMYKTVHGVRPRYWTQTEWDSLEFLEEQRVLLLDVLEKFTPEKRVFAGCNCINCINS